MSQNEIDYSGLPEHMRAGTRRWIEEGIIPGDFLQAVITNDLKEAVFRADGINIHLIVEWVQFFVWKAPSGSQGSPVHMKEWARHGGLNGLPF